MERPRLKNELLPHRTHPDDLESFLKMKNRRKKKKSWLFYIMLGESTPVIRFPCKNEFLSLYLTLVMYIDVRSKLTVWSVHVVSW